MGGIKNFLEEVKMTTSIVVFYPKTKKDQNAKEEINESQWTGLPLQAGEPIPKH